MHHKPVIPLVTNRTSEIVNGTVTLPLDDKQGQFVGIQNYESILFLIDITNAGAATTGTLQIYIQDTWDEGGVWDDLVASNTFTFGAAVTTQRFVIQGKIATSITQGSPAVQETLAAGTVKSGPFGDRIRIREKIAGITGGTTGVTYSIAMILGRPER